MKTLWIILLLVSIVQSDDKELRLESSIYYEIFKDLANSKRPKIYLYDEVPSIEKFGSRFELVKDCKKSNIVIIKYRKELTDECKDKILFGTKHQTLSNKNVVGAFFWQKGRPNILFYKTRLDQHNITLNENLKKYIDYEK